VHHDQQAERDDEREDGVEEAHGFDPLIRGS
jgi:hypothetical protein